MWERRQAAVDGKIRMPRRKAAAAHGRHSPPGGHLVQRVEADQIAGRLPRRGEVEGWGSKGTVCSGVYVGRRVASRSIVLDRRLAAHLPWCLK